MSWSFRDEVADLNTFQTLEQLCAESSFPIAAGGFSRGITFLNGDRLTARLPPGCWRLFLCICGLTTSRSCYAFEGVATQLSEFSLPLFIPGQPVDRYKYLPLRGPLKASRRNDFSYHRGVVAMVSSRDAIRRDSCQRGAYDHPARQRQEARLLARYAIRPCDSPGWTGKDGLPPALVTAIAG